MNTYYLISLMNGLDIQQLPGIKSENEAKEIADRLRFFFGRQGLDVKVFLELVEEVLEEEFDDYNWRELSRKKIDF